MTDNNDFHFEPMSEENGPLAKYAVGTEVQKTVQIMGCSYTGEQGFAIYDTLIGERRCPICGDFPYKLRVNAFYAVTGTVALDKRGCRQLRVITCESALPKDRRGIVTILQTLHGLNTQANKLYDILGPDVLQILMEDPQTVVSKVKGIGMTRAKRWQSELLAMGENDLRLKKLYALGLTQKQATKLVSEVGLIVCEEAERNPYYLMGKVQGYGFKKCDRIALDNQQSVTNIERIRAGVQFVVSSIGERGHCTYPLEGFMTAAHNVLDIAVNWNQANAILRAKGSGRNAEIMFGEKTFQIDLDDLQDALDAWSANRKADPFRFPVYEIDDSLIEEVIRENESRGALIREEFNGETFLTPSLYYKAEEDIASAIRDFTASERNPFSSAEQTIQRVLEGDCISLEQKQLEAVQRICRAEGGIFILNGPAGCGKTFTLNTILKVLRILHGSKVSRPRLNPCILAPTGKAAKVASAATGLEAKTIHRALGLISTDAASGGSLDSSYNCIIVDEFTMVDEILCASLLTSISRTAKVIMVGDTEQLPSIRSGKVLRDLIDSGAVPVITLDVVKRQSGQSGVLQNATHIIRGEPIESIVINQTTMENNAYIRSCADSRDAQRQVLRFAQKFGLEKFQSGQVQVLAPVKAGPAGVDELNYRLQQILNPSTGQNEIATGKMMIKDEYGRDQSVTTYLRVGDCVLHTRNAYDMTWYEKAQYEYKETSKSGVVNGETGIVTDIVTTKLRSGGVRKVVYVRYDNHYIGYDNDYDDLTLAYAMTIHKSQGSQWPIVICPLSQYTVILNRKLLYTMYTRAQSTSILITRDNLAMQAIRNVKEDQRLTLLKERLTTGR